MTLYKAAKWRTARLTRYSFRQAIAVALTFGLIALFLSYKPLQPALSYSTQRNVGLAFLLLELGVFLPMLWCRFHLGGRRPSLQMYVETREVVSFHWTPMPDWFPEFAWRLRGIKKRTQPVPRRAALVQFRQWITEAHAYGYREIRLDSAIFVAQRVSDSSADPGLRDSLVAFIDALGTLPEVVSIDAVNPRTLSRDREMFYRIFWPNAAKHASRSGDGRILAGGIVIHLAPSASIAHDGRLDDLPTRALPPQN